MKTLLILALLFFSPLALANLSWPAKEFHFVGIYKNEGRLVEITEEPKSGFQYFVVTRDKREPLTLKKKLRRGKCGGKDGAFAADNDENRDESFRAWQFEAPAKAEGLALGVKSPEQIAKASVLDIFDEKVEGQLKSDRDLYKKLTADMAKKLKAQKLDPDEELPKLKFRILRREGTRITSLAEPITPKEDPSSCGFAIFEFDGKATKVLKSSFSLDCDANLPIRNTFDLDGDANIDLFQVPTGEGEKAYIFYLKDGKWSKGPTFSIGPGPC